MENAELIKALRCKEYFDLCNVENCRYHLTNTKSGCKCAIKLMATDAADALEAADKRIAELEAAQRWISVGERLPTVSEYRNGDKFKSMDSNELVPFLVCCKDTEIPFRAFYDGKNWGDGWNKLEVTHWLPLPELPEQQQSKPDNTTTSANPYWQRVCAIADKQRAKGMAEYGQGLEDNPADIARRITYLEEELVDGLMYCEWIKARLDGERPESDDR